MSSLIKIIFSIFLIYYPINSYSNDDKKITISHLIQSAELTLKKISKNDDIKNFKNYLKNCRAILIFPEVYEGGFFLVQRVEMGLANKKHKPYFHSTLFLLNWRT